MKTLFIPQILLLFILYLRLPAGPVTSDGELLRAINLDFPGLSAVQNSAKTGDTTGALKAFCSYLRSRTSVQWSFDPHKINRNTPYNKALADTTVKGFVTVVGSGYQFPNGVINWFFNATDASSQLVDDNEWQWQLNRMSFWLELGKAYWATGDEKYAQAFVSQLRSWSSQCNKPSTISNGQNSAWRTIECGIRLLYNWPNTMLRMIHSPSFTDGDLIRYLKATYEQSTYLKTFPTNGNFLTLEMNGLFTSGGLFPEFKDAYLWRKIAIDSMYNQFSSQIQPDGSQIELSTEYQPVVIDNMRSIYDKAQIFGRAKDLSPDYLSRIYKCYEYLFKLTTPNRSLPRLNDGGDQNMVNIMSNAYTYFPNSTDFQWICTRGAAGNAPSFTSCFLPWAGNAVMRSGWDTTANYLVFDVGPSGYGYHAHQDKLSLNLFGFGKELLFDDGGGAYQDGAERTYARSTFNHNTVNVDGLPQSRDSFDTSICNVNAPIDCHWRSTPEYDFAWGKYDEAYGTGLHPATHDRRVFFIKPDLFIIADLLTPSDSLTHTYQARWQVRSTNTGVDLQSGVFSSRDAGSANIAIIPLSENTVVSSAKGQTSPERAGWFFAHTAVKPEIATTVFNTKTGKGPQLILTALMPLRPNKTCPVTSISGKSSKSASIVLNNKHSYSISSDLLPSGNISFVERDSANVILRQISSNGINDIKKKLPNKAAILEQMKRVNQYWISNNLDFGDNSGARSIYYHGNDKLFKASNDSFYYHYSLGWADKNSWKMHGNDTTRLADNQACGQSFIALDRVAPLPAKIDLTIKNIRSQCQSTYRNDWTRTSALYMAMPLFAQIGRQLNDNGFFQAMHEFYTDTKNRKGLYNASEALWYSDSSFLPPYKEPNNKNCYLSLANGFALAGLCRVLEELPNTDSHRQEYILTLQQMARTLKNLQCSDGLWSTSLLDPNNFGGPEAGGTSLILYGLAWGVNNRILDSSEYSQTICNAWSSLNSITVQPNGMLGYCQPLEDKPSACSYNVTKDYAVGAFLLAGSEVIKQATGTSPTAPLNLAEKKSVSSSNITNINNIVDGSPSTTWSADSFPQWVEIDLNAIQSISSLELCIPDNRAYQFVAEYRNLEIEQYNLLFDHRKFIWDGGRNVISFSPTDARFVKITITGCANDSSRKVALNEIRIYGNTPITKSVNKNSGSTNSGNNFNFFIDTRGIPRLLFSVSQDVKQAQFRMWDMAGRLVWQEHLAITNQQRETILHARNNSHPIASGIYKIEMLLKRQDGHVIQKIRRSFTSFH